MRYMLTLFITTALYAYQGIAPERIPPELRPWQDWVLEGHRGALCPTALEDPEKTYCAWPTRLDIRVDGAGGSFAQDWQIFNDSWIALPGGPGLWPQQVTVNGKAAAVIDKDGVPSLFLTVGSAHLEGAWRWQKAPQILNIPSQVGLVSLTVDGRVVRSPHRDEQNQLWLNLDKGGEDENEERLVVTVFRKFVDQVPMFDQTQVELEVGGQAREVTLPNPLIEGFTPLSLESDLPVRLDQQGNLVVQVRPGTWQLRLRSRSAGAPTELALAAKAAPWPETELWCFEARPQLRAVTPEGLPAVDPTQTRLPAEWQSLPSYEAAANGRLVLTEQARGLGAGSPDNATLTRELWLDGNGRGFTFLDHLDCTLNRQWRLAMTSPYLPGRVLLDGQPQLITVLDQASEPGIEARRQQLQLRVDGRIEARTLTMPSTGWSLTLDTMDTTLHLPPGWRLFAALGPDTVVGDWLHQWRLWDFFWVLVFSVGISRLYGKRAAAVAVVAMASLFHIVPLVPMFFVVLALAGLQRATAEMRWNGIVAVGRWLAFAILLVGAFIFLKSQILFAFYPQLAQAPPIQAFADATMAGAARDEVLEPSDSEQMIIAESPQAPAPEKQAVERKYTVQVQSGKVQTGPGIPNWSGELAHLTWKGPLDPDLETTLVLIPPKLGFILIFLRLALLLWVLSLLADVRRLMKARLSGAGVLVLPLLLLVPTRAVAQTPSKETLDELRTLLLRKADCYPRCAEIAWGELTDAGGELQLALEVHAVVAAAIPLPGQPAETLLDGRPANLTLDGGLIALIPPGVHRITATYRPDSGGRLRWNFRLIPRQMSAKLAQWRVSGIAPDGTCGETLELTPPIAKVEGSVDAGTKEQFQAFFTVTRTVTMDRIWNITTEVRRHNEGAAVIEIPLLPGENVVSGERVVDGKVVVNLAADADSYTWHGTADPRTSWRLDAPAEGNWSEVWRFQPSMLWHLAWQGTPAIEMFDGGGTWTPSWHPRPGESLDLTIVQPKASEGQVLTFDLVELRVEPGLRSSQATLTLRTNSSLGGEHTILLPPDIEIRSQTMDGNAVPPRLEQGQLKLPLAPGEHTHQIVWNSREGLKVWLRSPTIDLRQPAVNITTAYELPLSRWLLWVWGPRSGPALLFWGVVLVLLLTAYALSRSKLTSLSLLQWFLLGLGISQLHVLAGVAVVAWFGLVALRGRLEPQHLQRAWFILLQLAIVVLTLVFAVLLMAVLYTGLVAMPNLYLLNASDFNGLSLSWYQDRIDGVLPSVLMVSLPFWVYRVMMLLWALWLANSVMTWIQMGWKSFSLHGIAPKSEPRVRRQQPLPETGETEPSGPSEPPPVDAAEQRPPVPEAADDDGKNAT